VPSVVHDFLAEHDVDPAEIQHFVPHQANRRMLEDLTPGLSLSNARTHYTIDQYGNTGAASIPVTLAEVRNEIRKGDLVLLAAFGGGMAIGLTLLHW
jgi:3-oxoacyl-[acyl-carrier-protein] synthase-3